MSGPVYLIDGHAYLFRAYFGVPARATIDGAPCHAVFGFTATLARFLREKRPQHAAIAFDGETAQGFRRRLDPSYKSDREPPGPALTRQFAWCVASAEGLGFRTLRDRRAEADDLIGSVAARVHARGDRVVIVSPDKDFGQLVGPGVVQWDLARDHLVDAAAVRARWGVEPSSLPDLFGLLGDPTDNIPGVPGIGPKTGAALLQAYGTLEAIPEDPRRARSLSPRRRARAGTLLREHRLQAYRSRELARIRTDLEIDASAASLRWCGVDVASCEALLGSLGLDDLLPHVRRLAVELDPEDLS